MSTLDSRRSNHGITITLLASIDSQAATRRPTTRQIACLRSCVLDAAHHDTGIWRNTAGTQTDIPYSIPLLSTKRQPSKNKTPDIYVNPILTPALKRKQKITCSLRFRPHHHHKAFLGTFQVSSSRKVAPQELQQTPMVGQQTSPVRIHRHPPAFTLQTLLDFV